jgi:hypothetical protein
MMKRLVQAGSLVAKWVGRTKSWLSEHRMTMRVGFLVLLIVLAGLLAYTVYVMDDDKTQYVASAENPTVEPRNNTTVIAGQNPGKLVAFAPNGSLLYRNDTYDSYHDIDPSPVGKNTVLYTGILRKNLENSPCASSCVLNVLERVNMTTGEVTRLHTEYDQRPFDSEWHDVDRMSEDMYVVADMADNQVFFLNTTTDRITWIWRADAHYDYDTGGPYAEDWTHVNDVEIVRDGLVMASMRNHDEVIFIDPGHGVVENLTLGENDNYDILYEQHNPDYIPEEDGGPAVIVADSQNQRNVEFQRRDGEWVQTWVWRDSRMAWPRDADRLPNGHTLMSDSHGDRVLEVDESGDIVWSVNIHSPYDAERLGTGDESENGPSAVHANLTSRGGEITDGSGGGSRSKPPLVAIWQTIRRSLPTKLVNGFLFLLPPWIGVEEMFLLLSMVGTTGLWIVFEFWLSSLAVPRPIYRSRKD